jgi:bifunctional UDP-N-acetylglucosamine pyrophosphorylase / glucosamine-1-phosphate N-acetyltransferase
VQLHASFAPRLYHVSSMSTGKFGKFAVVVLAAGKGTRMKSDLPKVLHPVAHRPIIAHVLAAAARTIVVIGPGMENVAAAAAPAEIAIQEKPLGTGHAVAATRSLLAGALAPKGEIGEVLVLCGDAPLVTPATLQKLLECRRAEPAAAVAVLGMRPADPAPYGRLVIAADGSLEAIVEAKDATPEQKAIGYCNAGVLAIDGRQLFRLLDALDRGNAQGEYYLTDIVGIARRSGLLCRAAEGSAEETLGINSRADLAVVEAAMQQRLRLAAMLGGATLTAPETVFLSADTQIGRDVTIAPHVVIGPGVVIEDGVEIRSFSHLEGAHIGQGAIIGPFARLRPGAELGPEVHIGNFVEVKATKMGRGAKANHLAYLGDSEVGAKANIGAGTITCNYDGFFKEKTVIGEGAFIGSNTALVAPVTVGAGASTAAGSVITRDVPADALAIGRGQQVEKPGYARRYREAKAAEKAARSPKRKD